MAVDLEWENGRKVGMPYQWYMDDVAHQMYHDFIETVMMRENTISGVLYKDDPTIMAWQLANEPRTNNCGDYKVWI